MTDSKIHERSKTVVVDKLNNKVHWSHLSLCLFHRSKVFTLLYAELVKWHMGGCLCLACVCVTSSENMTEEQFALAWLT